MSRFITKNDLTSILNATLYCDAPIKTVFTPSSGSSYAGYGGCYYEVYGKLVHIHLGISGLTANTGTVVYCMPEYLRPSSLVIAQGTSGSVGSQVIVELSSTNGNLLVSPSSTYCGADIYYIIENLRSGALPTDSPTTFYTAAWTASSTSAYGAQVSGKITLPKGIYIICMKVPNVASGTFGGVQLYYGSGTLLDSYSICGTTSQNESTVLVEIPWEMEIYMATAGSASCTYTLPERGGLRAVKVG